MKKINYLVPLSIRLVKTSLFSSVVFLSGMSGVHAELPVPHAELSWSNNARIAVHTDSYMRIAQNQGLSGNWLLNWKSFNISEGSEIEFAQPSSTHIALNQIYQSNPSSILGSITANGRVYLINQNGFLFGRNSSINVNSLVASSLSINMSQDEFINGDKNIATLINEGLPSFIGSGVSGDIIIEDGASITTQEGGSVLMFAPNIFNDGDISTTSGQTILAASEDKVYLTPSTDPALRGFLVEVGTGGLVENGEAGHILSRRGNVTLAGLAINQNGVVEATSSVNENGSIRLLARDGAEMIALDDNAQMGTSEGSKLILGVDINLAKDANDVSIRSEEYAAADNTGDVILGETSQIIIRPEEVLDRSTEDVTDDIVTLTDAQKQLASRVEVTGNTIRMQKNAEIVTPAGEVVIHATSNPLNTAVTDDGVLRSKDDSKFVMESGSRIDVSGTTYASVAMERNQLEVQLTGNFLRDAPIQREGKLRNERVFVDVRDGTPLGDISELVAGAITRNAVERHSKGGTVSVVSQGGVLLEDSSEINIRGGGVNYEEGYVTSSRLISSNGDIVDIADANSNQVYSGVFGQETLSSQRWGEVSARSWNMFGEGGVTRFNQSYTEGKNAGSFNVQTHAAVLDNSLTAGTTTGAYQRSIASRGFGGSFNITLADPAINIPLNSPELSQSIAIVDENNIHTNEASLDNFLASSDVIPAWLLQINKDQLQNGLSSFSATTNGSIAIAENADINMVAGGQINLDGHTVDVNSDINIVSGEVNINSHNDLLVAGEINTNGNWVNDNRFSDGYNLLSEINLNGGSISLNSTNGNLLLQDSTLNVNGGVWLSSDGEMNFGNAGSIELTVNSVNGDPAEMKTGEMQAYAAGRGGKLKIEANRISIAEEFEQEAEAGELQISPEFFQSNGFSDYELISNSGNLVLQSGTEIRPMTQSLILDEDIKVKSSADSLLNISSLTYLPDYARPQANLTLGTNRKAKVDVFGPGLTIEQGARVELDVGAELNLFTERNLFMNGDLLARGGDVNLTVNVPSGSTGIKEYEANQAIWLGGTIDVRGAFVQGEPTDTGLVLGTVYNAGSVNFNAKRGYVVSSESSAIDVSGEVLNMSIDLPSAIVGNTVVAYERQPVVTEAGSVSLSASEGLLLEGRLSGSAADIEGASGADLTIAVDTEERGSLVGLGGGSQNGTSNSREIHIVQTTDKLPASPEQGTDIDSSYIGQAWVSVDKIKQGGFSNLTLLSSIASTTGGGSSRGVIEFHDDINLSLDQSLQMTASLIRGNSVDGNQVSLSAPYVFMGSVTGSQPESSDLITDGDTVLNIQAGTPGRDGLLEISGNIHLQNIGEVNLNSEGDIRLRGVRPIPNDTVLEGSLQTYGDLSLRADQVYATTLTEFDLNVTNTINGVLRVDAAGDHAAVLSAGSVLNFNAPVIEQAGVIKAPQGQINFNADQLLTLADGSVTSVSGEGAIVPFGSTLGQERWTYRLRLGSNNFTDISAPRVKEINLNAADVQIRDTATIDISGGGDLHSWEFVPGLGGSTDTLLTENSNGSFAVIPEMDGYAPFDDQSWADNANWLDSEGEEVINPNRISFGEQIYLNGSENLKKGLYTVLPPRYALLPGALLVSPTSENLLPSQSYSRLDGAPVVAGQSRVAGTDFYDQLWSGYVVESGESVRESSEYFESTASQFFRNQAITNDTLLPAMPEDAGSLNLLASIKLGLSGILNGDAASVDVLQGGQLVTHSGRGSVVNIGGDDIRIMNEVIDADKLKDDGVIRLDADRINGFGAISLMLGGTRQRSEQGINITETANSVTVESGVELNVPDLYIVSKNTIDVNEGAVITASGVDAQSDTRINLDGDGALLRASASEQIIINRVNESAEPLAGKITISQGAIVNADSAITLDSSSDTSLSGDLVFTTNEGSLGLGASQISIGDVTGSPDGLLLSTTDLSALNANELVLSSRSKVGFYGDLDLQFNNLSIQAGSIDGYQGDNQNLILRADTISLSNPADEATTGNASGLGGLSLIADNIVLGEGSSLLRGFGLIELEANQGIFTRGEGSLQSDASNVILDAAVISSALSNSHYAFDFSDAPLLIKNSASKNVNTDNALGSSLEINAKRITHQGNIRLASGDVSLHAIGSGADDVLLMAGSVIDVSGIERDFAGESVYTPGGKISLNSSTGDVIAQSTDELSSQLNVSAGAAQGNAGVVDVSAVTGSINLSANLLAEHGEFARGGSAKLDANIIADLSALNTKLNDNGFDKARIIRLRDGDLDISAGDSIVAQQVLLQADAGNVTVAGSINANGEKGGVVHLAALHDVALTSTADINASALSDDGEGGDIRIETTGGYIDLAAQSKIDVNGGDNYRDGTIYIRTLRNNNASGVGGLDLNIKSVASDMTGFRRLDLEAFEVSVLNDGFVDKNDIDIAAAKTYMDSQDFTKLDLSISDNSVHIRPGFELRPDVDVDGHPENIIINSAMNFIGDRFKGDEAGVLTIRSKENLTILESIGDAFLSYTDQISQYIFGSSKPSYESLQSGESWSYKFIAGADFYSVVNSTVNTGHGDLSIADNKYVRTGTGSIDLLAGNNITLNEDAAVYTSGESNGRGSVGYDLKPVFSAISLGYFGFELEGNALDGLFLPETEFPENGGDIIFYAGGNIDADPTSKLVTDWLHRRGEVTRVADSEIGSFWGVYYAGFKHGIGALGGGDVSVTAGGNIDNLAIAIPETGKQVGDLDITLQGFTDLSYELASSEIETNGRDDIDVVAGGDVNDAMYYVGSGSVNLNVQGNIGGNNSEDGLFLISANTRNNVFANGNINFQGANNQTLMPLSQVQVNSLSNIGLSPSDFDTYRSYYSTLTENTEIKLASLGGDIVIRNNVDTETGEELNPYSNMVVGSSLENSEKERFASILPSRFHAYAIDGNIDLHESINLWAGNESNIQLLANDMLTAHNTTGLFVEMLDVPVSDIPNLYNPAIDFTDSLFPKSVTQRSGELTYFGDLEISRFITNEGDITSTTPLVEFGIKTNQQTEIISGRDIVGVSLNVQHSLGSNVSIIQAARDFEHINGAQLGTTTKVNSIRVTGPGELHVTAGRNINLGDQKGIISAGNNDNPTLPDIAARLLVMAGQGQDGADYNAFINEYFTEYSAYADQLVSFMQRRDTGIESFASALSAFKSLQEKQQRSFILTTFSNEYRESAIRAANEQNGLVDDGDIFGYSRGLNAIATLFPGTIIEKRESQLDETTAGNLLVTGGSTYVIADNNENYVGNLSMVASTIQTQDNGADISILAPGGYLNVGLSVATGDDNIEKGIISKGDGVIDIYTFGDVAVNQSRIQALNTGGISIWSTQGNIDAGRGAKSALSFPPPRNVVDPETGAIIQVLDAAVQGNGIRTACFDLACKAGDVVLAAPKGVIDAGDAGINSGSGIILATETVLNANQIEAGGESTGVPTDAGSMGADLGGMDVNSVGEDAGTELIATDASDQFGAGSIAILQVEVMGLSGELDKTESPSGEDEMHNPQSFVPEISVEPHEKTMNNNQQGSSGVSSDMSLKL